MRKIHLTKNKIFLEEEISEIYEKLLSQLEIGDDYVGKEVY